ncbi:MAG TPA: hypothetical protein VFG50_17840 [Rhodothermales bacterium]|nr:hypothetical protein [Rhodothermales bacterium]
MTSSKVASCVRTHFGIGLLTLAALLFTAGCDLPSEAREGTVDANAAANTAAGSAALRGQDGQSANRQLAALRRATAAFHDVEKAEAAGWNVQFPPECLTHAELGGMGVHRFNPGLVDDTVIVTQPELIVYEPQANGRLRLVAVEYIIPFSIRPRDAAPPTLFGRPFMQNETYDVWALHAWAWKHNPRGTFQNFNPKVTCAYADIVRTFPE